MDTEIRILYDNQERTEYVMKAPPGTRTDESEWQILKVHYQSPTNDNITRLGYANNNSGFMFKADDYLLYKYTTDYLTSLNPQKNLPAGTIVDFLNPQDFTVVGNQPDFLDTENQFNQVDFISVEINNDFLVKGVDYKWVSKTSIKLMIPCEKNQGFLIHT